MANPLANLSEGQRRALMIGVPLVAAAGLGSLLGRRNAQAKALAATEAEPAMPDSPTGYIPPASTDVVGVGQLAEFESILSSQVLGHTQAIRDLEKKLGEKPAAGTPADAAKRATPGDWDSKCISLWGDDSKLVRGVDAAGAMAWVAGVSGHGGWNAPVMSARVYDLYGDGQLVSVTEMHGTIMAKGTPTNKQIWRC